MRTYTNQPLSLSSTIELGEPQFNHIARVMRKKVGDSLTLFNGDGGEFIGTITAIHKRTLDIHLHTFNDINRASQLNIHLIQSFAKFDKMDFVFQKAVELGVTHITPFTSEHSSFKLNTSDKQDKKLQHWQGIIESACEQSGLNLPPKLTSFTNIKTIQDALLDCPYLILSPTAEHSLGQWIHTQPKNSQAFGIIIGPEGGFSHAELTLLSSHPNCHPVTLGNRILRTETAALSVISSLQAILGDWS